MKKRYIHIFIYNLYFLKTRVFQMSKKQFLYSIDIYCLGALFWRQ